MTRAADSADGAVKAPAVMAPTAIPLTLLAPAGVTCDGDSCAF